MTLSSFHSVLTAVSSAFVKFDSCLLSDCWRICLTFVLILFGFSGLGFNSPCSTWAMMSVTWMLAGVRAKFRPKASISSSCWFSSWLLRFTTHLSTGMLSLGLFARVLTLSLYSCSLQNLCLCLFCTCVYRLEIADIIDLEQQFHKRRIKRLYTYDTQQTSTKTTAYNSAQSGTIYYADISSTVAWIEHTKLLRYNYATSVLVFLCI